MKCNSTKVLKYFLCFLFALFLLIIIYAKKCFSVSAYAIDDEILIPCNATTEDEFYDDIIIITLKHNASLQFYDYSKEDFEDINCESVEELTIYTSEIVREQIAANNSGDWSKLKERIDKNMLVNIETFHRILCLTINNPGKDNVLSAIKKLEERNDIISAEPDYFTWLESTASDSYYISGDQWGLNGPFGIKANTAWDTITGNHNTFVGILDTGIDASHPDLVNNISDNLHRDFVDHPLLIPYRDVSKADLTDNDGHGTHVAGIVGAQGNNGVGISGVAWNVKLVSLRVFGSNTGRSVYIKRAIDYATSKNIQVLNYSGGGNDYDNSLKMSIQNYPGLLICAAGNNGQNNDLYEHYPSNYDLPNIISVGASNSAGKWTPHSNFGATTVDIFAPGIDIISTYPTNLCSDLNHIFSDGTHLCELKANCAIYLKGLVDSGNYTWYDIESNFSTLVSSYYTDPIITISDAKDSDHMSYYYHEMIGTSMAAPHVTGVVSLLLSLNSNVTPLELKEAILHSAYHPLIEGVNPLENYCVTDGILSACEAVNYYITNSFIENSSYLLECYSKNNSSTQVCNAGNSIYYKFIINCNTSYKFVSNASCPINMTFYDEDLEVMSSITPTMSNNNCTGTIITTLTPGTYYLRVNYVSDSDTGNITTSFRPTTYSDGVELYLDTNNNINTHIHKTIDNNYHTEGYYENISGAGFYKITLTEGSNVYYPAGTIKIYEDSARQYLIDKYDVTGMNIPAVSNEGEM